MPIVAANERGDVRGSTRFLANTVRGYVVNRPAIDRFEKVYLNNLYRLLEGYRTHRVVAFEHGPKPATGSGALTLLRPTVSNVRDLRIALEKALRSVYGNTEDAAVSVETVLMAIAESHKAKRRDADKTTRFLDAFIENLGVAC